MEEILHQLVDGLSCYNPISYLQSLIVTNSYQLVQDFFLSQYDHTAAPEPSPNKMTFHVQFGSCLGEEEETGQAAIWIAGAHYVSKHI